MNDPSKPITSGLVAEIKRRQRAGVSLYALANAAQMNLDTLSRFTRGVIEVKSGTADKLAAHLGLVLIPRPIEPADVL